ncbi:hypothetical protein K9M18_00230 [Candidatus Woesearchaeota archaeon]|nr:hypothetical protein [Candidatus Woesearchaeota archaeon]MCF8012953.1 hypothetical protein [Candidatus Woesearchaeota archaeon]
MKKEHIYFLGGFLIAIVIIGIIYGIASPSITGGVTATINDKNLDNNIQNSENIGQNIKKDSQNAIITEQNNENTIPLTKEQNLINLILKLRESSNKKDIIQIAEYYNEINLQLKGTEVSNKWNEITACVYETCEDEKYTALIDSVASKELTNEKNQKIHNLIQTYYLWNGKNEELFSESLTQTNKQLNTGNTKELWEKIISCNGCEKLPELILQTTQKIVN